MIEISGSPKRVHWHALLTRLAVLILEYFIHAEQ